MSSYKELKREAYEANMEIPKHNLAIYTFGNVSAADREKGLFAIKPSGVAYDELTPDMMVVLDFDLQVAEGGLNPSSDTKTHALLYREFSTAGGVCHTHSPHAVGWAQACRPVPIFGTTHADHLATDVPVTRVMSDEAINRDYEEETGNQIIEAMRDLNPEEVQMILVACHGPFTWGKNAAKAVYNSVVLEELAKMAEITLAVNPETGRLKQALINKHYMRKHGKGAYYGQTGGRTV